MDSDSIRDGLTQNYLVRRADDDSTATSSHDQGSASASEQVSAATSTAASASSEKGKKSSSTAETAATSTDSTDATDATATKKKKNNSSFASPEILQTGTLFYVGVSVTTLLWITGKAIDVQTNRQERYAESLVHSI